MRNKLRKGLSCILAAGSIILSKPSSNRQVHEPLEYRLAYGSAAQSFARERYAVLINGSYESRHKKNIASAARLLHDLEYCPGNIFCLDVSGQEEEEYHVDGTASIETLEIVFTHLAGRIDSNDSLLIYVTGHGDQVKSDLIVNGRPGRYLLSTIVLPGKDCDLLTFAQYLAHVKPNQGIYIFDQCHGGGFASYFGHGRVVGISACMTNDMSVCNTFPQEFFRSFYSSRSDVNHNGLVSILEAFEHARNNDTLNKDNVDDGMKRARVFNDPQIFSDIDAGDVYLY